MIILQVINHIKSKRSSQAVQHLKEKVGTLETKIDNLSINLNEYLNDLPSTSNKRVKELFHEGYQAKKAYDWGNAIKFFHKALEYARGMEFVTLQTLIGNCHFSQGHLDTAIEIYNSTLTTAQQINDIRNRAVLLGNIGLAYLMKGHLDKAKDNFYTSLKLAEEQSMQKCAVNQYGNLGIIHQVEGDLNEALNRHKEALTAAQKINYRDAIARRLCSIALTYQALGKIDDAIEYANKGMTIALKLNDKQTKIEAFNTIGIINSYIGDLHIALENHESALLIAEEIGDKVSEANQLGNIGIIYRLKKQFNEALEKERKVLVIFKEIGNDLGVVSAMNGIAIILMERGIRDRSKKDTKEAAVKFEKALLLANKMKLTSIKASILNNIGILYWFINKPGQAMQCHEEVLRIAQTIGNKHCEGSALVAMGMDYERMGDLEKALGYYKNARDIFSQIGAKRKNANVRQAINDLEKKIQKKHKQ